MKITAVKTSKMNALNLQGDKELINRIRIIATNPRFREYATQSYYKAHPSRLAAHRFITVCDARFFMGRSASASTVYCSAWIHGKDGSYYSGKGDAGGYGYHKESAALECALDAAGFEFAKGWGGSGEQAMNEALLAVARRVGWKSVGLV
jgi:hypothetical protein